MSLLTREMSPIVYRLVAGCGVALATVVGVGGFFAYKMLAGAEMGEACTDSSDCRGFDPVCLEDETGAYCSVDCSSDADCPSGWTCGGARDDFTQLLSNVCGRGAPTAIVDDPLGMPGHVPGVSPTVPGTSSPATPK